MKIDILTLAAAAMPLVPRHLKPLAEAVAEEFKAQREQAKAQAQHIADLHRYISQAHSRIDILNEHVKKLSHMALVNANGAAN